MPRGAFDISLKEFKQGFFDRKVVTEAMDKVTHEKLSQFGAFVMTRAQRSIRPSKKSSEPGKPPRSHVGLLREMIFFAYEPKKRSVVIGPTLIDKPTGAPKTLEYGGEVSVEGRTIFIKQKGGRGVKGYNKIKLHGTRKIVPRPYMHPAFDAELPKHMDRWKNSIR